MPRFFIDMPTDSKAVITGSDAVHIGRSLRMKLGDEITLCSQGIDFNAEILTISDSEVVCEILSSHKSETEPNVRLTLFQAMPKSDKMDLIVQKAVELGAFRICPVLTERCVSRPDSKSFEKKRQRWQKIALEAAKQSGRGIIPEIGNMLSFKECVTQMQNTHAFMCYEKGGKSLSSDALSNADEISLLIGSEGGFEQSEADFAAENGITLAGLGSRILRCETAPIAAISIIMSITGNM